MINILISGICGHMGRTVLELVSADEQTQCVCGVDLKEGEICGVPVYKSFDRIREKVDVVIDFPALRILITFLPSRKNRERLSFSPLRDIPLFNFRRSMPQQKKSPCLKQQTCP